MAEVENHSVQVGGKVLWELPISFRTKAKILTVAYNVSSVVQLLSLSLCDPTAAAKSLQSCPTLCDPTDGLPPGSPVPGILQARVLEWGTTAFSDT